MDIAAEVLALEERSVDESSAIIVRSTSHRWRIRWKRIQDDRAYTDGRHAIERNRVKGVISKTEKWKSTSYLCIFADTVDDLVEILDARPEIIAIQILFRY